MILSRLFRAMRRPGPGPESQGATPSDPAIPAGQTVYAIGDIHGEAALLRQILEQVGQDIGRQPDSPSVMVIFLGDYIDRGPDSRGVLDLLLSNPLPGAGLHFLRGNHEQAMLDFLLDPVAAAEWLRFGGVETLTSYGVRAAPGISEPGRLRQLADDLAGALPPAHLSFLRATRLMMAVGDYAFVHAGIQPGIPLNQQRPDDLLWIREGFVDRPFQASHVIVHGHTVTDEPVLTPYRIGLDTGAYATGILTAAVLRGTQRRVLQTRRAG